MRGEYIRVWSRSRGIAVVGACQSPLAAVSRLLVGSIGEVSVGFLHQPVHDCSVESAGRIPHRVVSLQAQRCRHIVLLSAVFLKYAP